MEYSTTLINQEEVAKDTIAFYFSKPEGFSYKAGQSIDLTLLNPPETDDKGNTRAFSLTSAPHEDYLIITTRMTGSAFKRVLKSFPEEIELKLAGPFGSFTLHNDSHKPAVFLTGGIGITPAYSIIKQAAKNNLPHKLFLFYSNSIPEEAAFLWEFQELQSKFSNFTFIPTITKTTNPNWKGKIGRISKEMLTEFIEDLQTPVYYICGPAGMVSALKQTLLDAQVNEDNIRTEDFPGY
jgi:ferredoxin-NADP reductase